MFRFGLRRFFRKDFFYGGRWGGFAGAKGKGFVGFRNMFVDFFFLFWKLFGSVIWIVFKIKLLV